MFRKIILGYKYSPSLGDELLKYERKLRRDLKWRIFSIFLISFMIFSITLPVILKPTPISHPIEIKRINHDSLLLSSKIIFAPEKITENSEIIFELRAKNTSNELQVFNFNFQSSDILEYADILSQKGLIIEKDFSYFAQTEIAPNSEEIKQFTAKVKNKIPIFARKTKITTSYDCKIELFFGNPTLQKIPCPLNNIKNIISIVDNSTTDYATIVFIVSLLLISVISAFRTNLLLKQIKFIRRGF